MTICVCLQHYNHVYVPISVTLFCLLINEHFKLKICVLQIIDTNKRIGCICDKLQEIDSEKYTNKMKSVGVEVSIARFSIFLLAYTEVV